MGFIIEGAAVGWISAKSMTKILVNYFRSGDNIEKIIGICRLFNDYDIPCEIIVYDEKN